MAIQSFSMRDSRQILDAQFLEMRWRCLSLAADLDRIERGAGGAETLERDQRLQTLKEAIRVLLDGKPERAERVQMFFSDRSPPPPPNPQ